MSATKRYQQDSGTRKIHMFTLLWIHQAINNIQTRVALWELQKPVKELQEPRNPTFSQKNYNKEFLCRLCLSMPDTIPDIVQYGWEQVLQFLIPLSGLKKNRTELLCKSLICLGAAQRTGFCFTLIWNIYGNSDLV